MPYIGKQLSNGNYLKLDDISSSFDGSTTTFSLTNGGSAYYPGSEFSILVSVGGVIQEPESAYQISNDEITFANAPTAQDSFFCVVLGDAIGINVPGNNTVNGTQMAKPFNYDGGLLYLNDTDNRVGINSTSPSVALDVVGDLNVSGNISGIGGTLGGTLVGNVYASSGISTFYDLRVTNNLTVEGTTTTLDTDLIGVDRVEVDANSNSIVGVAITQSGTADIINLFDGTTEVLTVLDTGEVGIGTVNPLGTLHVQSNNPSIKITDATQSTNNKSWNISAGVAQKLRIQAIQDGGGGGSQYFDFYRDGTKVEEFRGAKSGNPWFVISNNTQKVGIGTDVPSQLLHLQADAAHQILLKRDGASPSEVAFKNSGNYAVISNNTNGIDLQTGTTPSSSMHIDQDGKVGITTEEPQRNLHIHQNTAANAYLHMTNATTGASTTDGFSLYVATDGQTYYRARESTGTHVFYTGTTEKLRIGDDGQITQTAASGDTVLTLKRSDTNTTGLTGGINFAASDDHSVANIQAIGDGDNEGAHILFKTTTAAAGDIFNAATVERLRINSHGQIITGGNGGISFNNVGNSAFGSFFEINGTHTINHCGVLGISGITTTNNTRVGLIQFLNTSNTNSSSTGNAASRSLAHITVYADTSDDNAGNDSGGRMVFSTKAEADGTNELLFLTSDKTVGIQAIPAVGDMDSTATGGADLSDPKLYVYDGGTDGKYNLMIRCNSGSDADNTGSAIALNHSNDRGLLIEGGRWAGNRSWGALKAIDNVGRVTDAIAIRGGNGAGVQDVRIYTGEAVATTERLRVDGGGRVGIGTINPGYKLVVWEGDYPCLQSGKTTFKVDQHDTNWTNLPNNTGPILGWDWKSGPGDLFYIGSGGNTSMADQMALVVSDGHGVKVGRSGYDGTDYDVSSTAEYFRITNEGKVGIGTNNPTKILDVLAKDGVTQTYIEKQTGSTNNTYQSALTLSARSGGAAAANYGPAIGFQHCFGGSNYAGCQITSQCGSDANTASIRLYPRNYGYTEAMRISHNGLVNIGAVADNTAIHASGIFNGATPKFEIKLGGASNSYKRLINITNPGAQTGSETLGRVGIKLSLGSEASSGESNKSGIIYAESTSGYNNGTALCLATTNVERLRIDSGGTLITGNHTNNALAVHDGSSRGLNLTQGGRIYCKTDDHWDFNRPGGGLMQRFRNGNDNGGGATQTVVGNITINASSVSFNETQSDSRLKKNIVSWTDEVLPNFKTLQPKKFHFNWEFNSDPLNKGYVAQDLASAFPEAYQLCKTDIGESEEVDRYFFNPSGMVKYLMKAVQEEIVKREALEARITALEGS